MNILTSNEYRQLKYVASIEMGQSPPSSEYSLDERAGLPFLQGTADFGTYHPQPRVYCDTPTKLATTNDILFSVRAPVGELNIANQQYGIGRGLCAIKCNDNYLDRAFAWWALHWSRTQLAYVVTGSTYEAVSVEDVANLRLPYFPLATQRAIADYLDRETARIDGLIGAKQRLLALLAEKRFAAINEAVSYGLDSQTRLINDPNIPWLDGIPSHWTIEQGRYLFTQSSLPVRDEDEIVTCFRDGQVTLRRNRRTEGFTNAILELGYQGIRTGQLVVHSMDAFAGAIGISDSNGKCSPEYIVCDAKTYHVFLPYYSHLLRVMALKGFIQASCPAVRERAPRIRFTDLSDMFFPLPPYKEQVRVAEHIKSAIKKIDALRNHTLEAISLLQERRTALIAAAVTGQIDTAEVV